MPGALVTARQTETNVTVDATSDAAGRFRFSYLRIGTYEVIVRLQGFRTSARTLVVSAGSAFDIPISLQVARLDSAVTVLAETPTIETARSQISGTVL